FKSCKRRALEILNRAARRANLLRVATGRLPNMSAEGCAESTRGAVTHALGNLLEPQLLPAQQSLGQRHAPCEEILHGRQTNGPDETVEEDRARQSGFPGKLCHRPRTRRRFVHLPDRQSDSGISQSA